MTLGNKIQELRKQQSLSQEAFAEVMGVTRQSVSKWELDLTYPAIDKIVEMADFFNISLDEMLRNEGNSIGTTQNKFNNKNDNVDVIHKNVKCKELSGYFIWWAVLAILVMVLFGFKEYFAGFIVSQILVWSTVIINIYNYMKRKNTTKE